MTQSEFRVILESLKPTLYQRLDDTTWRVGYRNPINWHPMQVIENALAVLTPEAVALDAERRTALEALLKDSEIVNSYMWYADTPYSNEEHFQAVRRIREIHLPALGTPSQWKDPDHPQTKSLSEESK